MVDGFGAITWWGFSPALDFQEKGLEGLHVSGGDGDCEEFNVLMIGAGDCRHILKTISRKHRYPKKKINFYVIENSLEIYARHMLLLNIALESPQKMGFQEKTELFLEIYGNSLIRSHSSQYIVNKANEFIKYVTDLDYMKEMMPIFDISALKFKERDQLEAIYKFWRNPDVKVYDISKYWDDRVRKHLGVRYDNKQGAFDWDYSMKLCEKDAKIINIHVYSQWRRNGVAFETREGDYDSPNKTLASGMIFKVGGDRIAQRGYWGDIVTSPFITFGIECEEKSLLKKANDMHMKTSRDVSEYNVLSMLYELTNNEIYVMPKQDGKDGTKKEEAKLTEITEDEEEEDVNENAEEPASSESTGETAKLIQIEDVTVNFLPLSSAQELKKKSKYHQLFHLVYFSNSMVHNLTPEINTLFSERACVMLETAKFMLDLKKEQTDEFVKKVSSMAKSVGCEPQTLCNSDKDSAFLKFTFRRKDQS
ncbi:dynein axonemal assembly factor 3-like [Saccoglossus kowalevskii]|uniref:Dynein assembly factor 3, axonemal-like n=1 Tax=Saccoglossus kowalevskii TaxID=10224 RepID=A0ABM0M294_SACKO|nr:PREDICTED: dynein assembly factor 3, axonemal-like [Saccoglossus kowalevskii]